MTAEGGDRSLRPFTGTEAGVHSEIGVLRAAMLDTAVRHPALGERSVDALAAALHDRGIRVLGLRDLLVDLLGSLDARRGLVSAVVDAAATTPVAARRLRRLLLDLEPEAAVRALQAGLPARDWDRVHSPSDRDRFLLPPLPTARSLRSTAVVAGRRILPALPGPGQTEARRSVALTSTIQRLHPALLSLRPIRYRADPDLRRSAAQLDGDDVLLVDDAVVVGIGHRSSAHGARQLARTLLELDVVRAVVVVTLPRDPLLDRLDRVVGVVDDGVAVVHAAAVRDDLRTWTLRLDPHGRLTAADPVAFRDVLGPVLGIGRPIVLTGGVGPADLLPLEPGALLTSAGPDDPAVRMLRRRDVEVCRIEGAMSPAGGIRRLVQPVQRDRVRSVDRTDQEQDRAVRS
ncbi:arginine deiminase [Amnibacterium kyonggiense]